MTRTELEAAVGEVLGIHATPDRVGTIVLLADAYAVTGLHQVAETISRLADGYHADRARRVQPLVEQLRDELAARNVVVPHDEMLAANGHTDPGRTP